nr:hypothetical protein [Tanacetum cinerariifolium]
MSSFNQRECLGCGQPYDGLYCYPCTCQQCRVGLTNGICLNCTYRDGKPLICCEFEGPLIAQREQELHEQEQAAQREQELLAQKQAAQKKEEPPQNSDFRQLIREMCGIKASAEQKKKLEKMMLEWLELCREKELYRVHDSIEDLIGRDMNTMLLSINLKSQRLDMEKQEVKNIVEQATKPEEPEDSLSMGDEHLSTIPVTKSNEVIKSSVKNIVVIPSEFEVTSECESECDVPVNDESSLIFTAFSNPLFDCNDDFTSSDDKSLSNEDSSPKFDYLLKEFSGELAHIDPILPGIEETDFDLEEEICLVENLLYDNSSSRSPKELNAEIADTILESLSLPPIPFKDKLLSNDSLPLPKNESSNFDHHDDPSFPRPPLEPPDVEVFFDFEPDTGVLTTKVVKGIYEHYVLMPNILPTLSTLDPDLDFTPSHDSLRSENKIFYQGIFIEV